MILMGDRKIVHLPDKIQRVFFRDRIPNKARHAQSGGHFMAMLLKCGEPFRHARPGCAGFFVNRALNETKIDVRALQGRINRLRAPAGRDAHFLNFPNSFFALRQCLFLPNQIMRGDIGEKGAMLIVFKTDAAPQIHQISACIRENQA